MEKKTIQWNTKLIEITKIKPTPTNYKIRNALGYERLKTSLKKFGIAGTVVVNTDYTLIDGNSRLEQEREKGNKKLWVSIPDRKLSPAEFKEMSAMFDFAKAGDVDTERINGDLGSKKAFYDQWDMEVPKRLLDKIGKQKVQEYQDAKKQKKETKQKEATKEEQNLNDIVVIQLFFSNKQADEFRKLEEKHMKKVKKTTTTETVLEVYRKFK